MFNIIIIILSFILSMASRGSRNSSWPTLANRCAVAMPEIPLFAQGGHEEADRSKPSSLCR